MNGLNILIFIVVIIYGVMIPTITIRQILRYYKTKKIKEEPLSKKEKIKELEKQIEKLKK